MTWEQIELFERWLSVVGYEGYYEVSDWGRVRSLARSKCTGRVLVLKKGTNGYLQVCLSVKGRKKDYRVHRLVAEAFLGTCPVGKQVDHIDGDRTHNSVLNLRYITGSENVGRAFQMGRSHKGEKAPWAKFSDKQISEMRRLSMEGMSNTDIARLFGISDGYVSRLISKKRRLS